jgi:hypothetical protein
MTQIFLGPTKYAVYGNINGQVARITGCKSLAECDDVIATHQKQYSNCTYSIWQAEWTKIREVKP